MRPTPLVSSLIAAAVAVVAAAALMACDETGVDCTRSDDCIRAGDICLDNLCQPLPPEPSGGAAIGTAVDAGASVPDASADVSADVAADTVPVDPCTLVSVSPTRVSLGRSEPGADAVGSFRVRNGTTAALSITALTPSTPLIAVDATVGEALPLAVRPGRSVDLRVRVVAGAGDVEGTVNVSAPPCTLSVEVEGVAR